MQQPKSKELVDFTRKTALEMLDATRRMLRLRVGGNLTMHSGPAGTTITAMTPRRPLPPQKTAQRDAFVKVTSLDEVDDVGIGFYWGRLQKRNTTPFAVGGTTLDLSLYFENANEDPVLLVAPFEDKLDADRMIELDTYHWAQFDGPSAGDPAYPTYIIKAPGISLYC